SNLDRRSPALQLQLVSDNRIEQRKSLHTLDKRGLLRAGHELNRTSNALGFFQGHGSNGTGHISDDQIALTGDGVVRETGSNLASLDCPANEQADGIGD